MVNEFIYAYGYTMLILTVALMVIFLHSYIERVLKNQTKIKCLCRHEYEPYSAFQCLGNGIEYKFKCRKCGKIISIETVTDDKFNWVGNKPDNSGYYRTI